MIYRFVGISGRCVTDGFDHLTQGALGLSLWQCGLCLSELLLAFSINLLEELLDEVVRRA